MSHKGPASLISTMIPLAQEGKKSLDNYRQDLKKDFASLKQILPDYMHGVQDLLNTPFRSLLAFSWVDLLEEYLELLELLQVKSWESEEEKLDTFAQFWESSSFLDFYFIHALEQGGQLEDINDELTSMLENQILSFYALHLTDRPSHFESAPLCYFPIPQWGDSDHRIYFGSKANYINLEKSLTSEEERLYLIAHFAPHSEIVFEEDDEDHIYRLMSSHALSVNQKKISLRFSPKLHQMEEKALTVKIQEAIEYLQQNYSHFLPLIEELVESVLYVEVEELADTTIDLFEDSMPGILALPAQEFLNASYWAKSLAIQIYLWASPLNSPDGEIKEDEELSAEIMLLADNILNNTLTKL